MRILAILASLSALSLPVSAAEAEAECYDLKVVARAINHLPTVVPPEEAEDRIILSWPWFVDLDVELVLEGEGTTGVIPVLAVLHGAMGNNTRTYFLRSNTAGSFNLIRSSNEDALRRCPADGSLASPRMWDLTVKSIEDYRLEAEKEERRYLDDDEESK